MGVLIEEVEMQRAEQLINKADALLAERGYAIEATDYESYATTLENFVMTSDEFSLQEEGILRKVGDVVRKAAHAYGKVKGGIAGAKARWSDFKSSVKGAFSDGHKKSFDKLSGRSGTHAPAHAAKKDEPAKKAAGGKKGRGGKMSDKEYQKRYKSKRRISDSIETTEGEFEQLMDNLRNDFFEGEFASMSKDALLALEALMKLDEGTERDVLVKKLVDMGTADPLALAAWIDESTETIIAPKKTPSASVSAFMKLSGAVTPMQGWTVPDNR